MTTRVVLSAGNIAHYHHAAWALQEAGLLRRYLCALSGWEADAWWARMLTQDQRKRLQGKHLAGLDSTLVQTIPVPYIATQALRRTGLISVGQANIWFSAWFDWASRKYVNQADIFHHVEGLGLQTAQNIKKHGGLIICDVRSQHICAHEAILQSEYHQLGLHHQSQQGPLQERLLAEYDLADFVIAPSSYVVETLVENGIPRAKTFMVPYGADLSKYASLQSQTPHKETDRPFRVLFVGQVVPLKGLHYLIEAFVNLRLPRSELLIFGRGEQEYQDLLQKMIPANQGNIRFLGHVPQIELWQYYQNSDVFVLPSLSEGSALVVYEAMSAGLPIITTSHAGAVLRDGIDGFIVPIRDVKAIQDQLTFLYEHPQKRRAIGATAREYAGEFTWERYRKRLLEVYRQIEQREK